MRRNAWAAMLHPTRLDGRDYPERYRAPSNGTSGTRPKDISSMSLTGTRGRTWIRERLGNERGVPEAQLLMLHSRSIRGRIHSVRGCRLTVPFI